MTISSNSQNEISLQDLDPRLQAQYEKAATALKKGDLDYAIEVADGWVKTYPHVPEFRMLLREAEIQKIYPNRRFENASMNPVATLLKWIGYGEKNTDRALVKCEAKLQSDPLDVQANEMLAGIARKLGWSHTEIFALQTMLLHPRRKPDQVIRLIDAMLLSGQVENASKVCETFLKVFPEETRLLDARKKISIRQSIQRVET